MVLPELGFFARTLAFIGVGFRWGRHLGRREVVEEIDRVDRQLVLQANLRHVERDHEPEIQHRSERYRTECERRLHGDSW